MQKLRDVLLPSTSPERISLIVEKIKEIAETIDSGKQADHLINKFNQLTGREYDVYSFQNYWRSESIEDFARDAAQPVPRRIADITKAELVEIVTRIVNADDHSKFYLELLERNLPHPRISNLIYWPEKEGLTQDSTPEEIVNKAMSYKPIQL